MKRNITDSDMEEIQDESNQPARSVGKKEFIVHLIDSFVPF